MSDPEKKKIHYKLTYLKRKVIEKIKIHCIKIHVIKIHVFHDFGGINVSVTFLRGSKKDKNFCMSSKPKIGNQPSQNIKESLKAEISRLCLKFVESDPTNEERD